MGPYPFFSFFLFLFLQHKKEINKKCNFFSKTSFLTSPKFAKTKKNTILAQCDTICASKHAQKHYKNGETVNKLGPVFNFKLGPIFNFKTPNLGPAVNFTAYIYIHTYIHIYIYMHAVKLLIGPSLAIFKVINWAKSKVSTGPRSFSHYKNRGFRRFFVQLSLCVFFGAQLSGNFLKIAFLKKGCTNWVFQSSVF